MINVIKGNKESSVYMFFVLDFIAAFRCKVMNCSRFKKGLLLQARSYAWAF